MKWHRGAHLVEGRRLGEAGQGLVAGAELAELEPQDVVRELVEESHQSVARRIDEQRRGGRGPEVEDALGLELFQPVLSFLHRGDGQSSYDRAGCGRGCRYTTTQ